MSKQIAKFSLATYIIAAIAIIIVKFVLAIIDGDILLDNFLQNFRTYMLPVLNTQTKFFTTIYDSVSMLSVNIIVFIAFLLLSYNDKKTTNFGHILGIILSISLIILTDNRAPYCLFYGILLYNILSILKSTISVFYQKFDNKMCLKIIRILIIIWTIFAILYCILS